VLHKFGITKVAKSKREKKTEKDWSSDTSTTTIVFCVSMLLIDKNFLILPLREVHWKIQKILDVGPELEKNNHKCKDF